MLKYLIINDIKIISYLMFGLNMSTEYLLSSIKSPWNAKKGLIMKNLSANMLRTMYKRNYHMSGYLPVGISAFGTFLLHYVLH